MMGIWPHLIFNNHYTISAKNIDRPKQTVYADPDHTVPTGIA